MNTYEHDFFIDSTSLDNAFCATFPRLMSFAQDSGTLHTTAVGYSPQWFVKNRQGWVILKWDCHFYSFPPYGETVTVRTWPSHFKGFAAERSYEILQNNSPIMQAQTAWLYMDLEKRRPIRLVNEEIAAFGSPPNPIFKGDFHISPITSPLSHTKAYTVQPSDIDINGHVNNVKYLYWVMEDLTYDEVKAVKQVKTFYKKECVLGQFVTINLYKTQKTIAAQVVSNGEVTTDIEIFLKP